MRIRDRGARHRDTANPSSLLDYSPQLTYQVDIRHRDCFTHHTTTKRVSHDVILHFQYSIDPQRPWIGVSPLKRAQLSTELATGIETAMRTASGRLVTVSGQYSPINTNLTQNQGNQPTRFGFDPPAPILNVSQNAAAQLATACGVPLTWINGGSGSDMRES